MHPQYLPWETVQAHTAGRMTSSNAFARSSTNATAPNSSSPARHLNISHLQQKFPTVCWAPPVRHLKCSQSFPSTYQRRHKRNQPHTCDIFRNQKEHRGAGMLRPLSTSVHLFQYFHNFSSFFLSSNPKEFLGGSRRILLLVQSGSFFQLALI